MRTPFGHLLLAGLVFAAPPPLRATEPAAETGRVLILDNERTMEGEVVRVDDQYRVRRAVGETWVPADKVLRVCASREDAYAFLRGRTNLDDPDERLRLAEWCRLHGLPRQALAEVQEAVRLRPTHPSSKRLLEHLREQTRAPGPPAPPPGAKNAEPVAPVELTADALGLFVTKVQPILMNACARCHVAGRGGSFQLQHAFEASLSDRRTMDQNLTAVLAQVNVRQPEVSSFLTKAVSAHAKGMNQAPLRGRQAPAYRALEDWVRLTVAGNPQLQPREQAAGESPTAPPRAAPRFGEDQPARPAAPVPAAPPPAAPAKSRAPDPVDPADFNRQYHPGQETPAPKP
jgi:hypothetical protein